MMLASLPLPLNELVKDNMDIELRDYFAAKAMAALITETGLMLDDFTDQAYEIADKMMESRDKRRKETQADIS